MSEVYRSIVSEGVGLDLGHVGTRVINTLRMEKGFRGWVHRLLVWVHRELVLVAMGYQCLETGAIYVFL